MVAGFPTTSAISAYHHQRGVLDKTLCDKVYYNVVTGDRYMWFSPGTTVSCTNNTDRQLKYCLSCRLTP